jgi:chemotaxis protein methyltransferase CheR
MSLINDPILARIAAQVEAGIGLVIEKWQYSFLLKNIEKRQTQLKLNSLSAYWSVLQKNRFRNPEFQSLVNLVTNNETFFFRIPNQYRVIENRILPLIRKKKKEKRLKVWSAGCSSGEEIYTFVLLMMANKEHWKDWHIDYLATDINQSILRRAREGLYRRRSIQLIPKAMREGYFTEESEGKFRLSEDIRNRVTFGYYNLADSCSENLPIDHIDLIFFRNVMIYFKYETISRIMVDFSRILSDVGLLLLGPAETLWKVSNEFHSHIINDVTFYRRKDGIDIFEQEQESRPPEPDPSKDVPPRDSVGAKRKKKHRQSGKTQVHSARVISPNHNPGTEKTQKTVKREIRDKVNTDYVRVNRIKTLPVQSVPVESDREDIESVLLDIKAAMDCANWDNALSLGLHTIKSFPDSATLNFLLSLIYDQRNDSAHALSYCRRVVYLKENLHFGRLFYAGLLRKAGKHSESLVQYREIMKRHLKGKHSELLFHSQFIPFDDQRVFFEAKRMLEKG